MTPPAELVAVAETVAQLGAMNVTRTEDPPEGAAEEAVVGMVAEMRSGPPVRPGLMQL